MSAIPAYVRWDGNSALPSLTGLRAISALVILDKELTPEQRTQLALTLVEGGCVAVSTWGVRCEEMHDAIDVEAWSRGLGADGPYIVMTTWHAEKPFDDAMFFFKYCSFNPDIEIVDYVIVDVSGVDRRDQMLAAFVACSGDDEGDEE